jgi:hypothetical protein
VEGENSLGSAECLQNMATSLEALSQVPLLVVMMMVMMLLMVMMSILTSAISVLSCSFYSYTPHFPSPSPSFLISLYPYYHTSQLEAAEKRLQEALEIERGLHMNDTSIESTSLLNNLGVLYRWVGRFKSLLSPSYIVH